MRTYRRLTYEDRCQIYALRTAGITQAEIGKTLGFSQGTVSRELARNTGQQGYRFQQRTAPRSPDSSSITSTRWIA
jgi:transposase, IS30 family